MQNNTVNGLTRTAIYRTTLVAILLLILGSLVTEYPRAAVTWIFASSEHIVLLLCITALPVLFYKAYQLNNIAWYEYDKAYAEVLALSQALLNTQPNFARTIFVSLGQSPAWVVRGAKIIADRLYGPDSYANNFRYLPFSYKFYGLSKSVNEKENAYFVPELDFLPSKDQKTAYRKFLTQQSMDPISITSRFNNDGITTVLVEYVETGESLASFISILAAWSREQDNLKTLQKALKIVCLKGNSNRSSTSWSYLVLRNTDTDDRFKITWLDGKPYARHNVHEKRSILNLLGRDHQEDRLVPYYPPALWGQKPKASCNTKVAKIYAELIKAAEDRCTPLYKKYHTQPIQTGQNNLSRRSAAHKYNDLSLA